MEKILPIWGKQNEIPIYPNQTYKNKSWRGISGWLGK